MKKILIIEDDTMMRALLVNMLSEEFNASAMSCAKDAISWLETNLPDLIISDIQMDEMDGFELLTYVRERGYTKHTPVIMLSAKEESKERIRSYRLGAQDYLTKPFNPEELNEIIKKNLYPIHFAKNW